MFPLFLPIRLTHLENDSIMRTCSFPRFGSALSLVFLALAAWGCGGDDDPGPPVEPFFDVATVKTAWPEVRDCRLSIEHDAVNITVYTDPASESAYVDGVYPFAEGTIIVKAEHDDSACTELLGFTAMRKLAPGAAPEVGDWEWQRMDAEGNVYESGSIMRCAVCHQSCAEQSDYACTNP